MHPQVEAGERERTVPRTATWSSPAGSERLVWYVGYGSNLLAARFRCYLAGGRPRHAARTYPGCRDRSLPRAAVNVRVPGALVFAGRSTVWGGGIAIRDPAAPGQVAGRAYLVSLGQLSDLVAQETRQRPGRDLVLEPGGRIEGASGLYDTVHGTGHLAGHPSLTLGSRRPVVPSPPGRAYLRTMMAGLSESFHWGAERQVGYLLTAAGVGQAWSRDQLLSLAREVQAPPPGMR